MDDELERIIEQLINTLCNEYERQHRSKLLWEALVLDGNFSLVQKLHSAEINFPGYSTIVVPINGFSDNDRIHNMVLDWCKERHIRMFNVNHQIALLEKSQTWAKSTVATF
jgi:hypothetical protein